MKNKQLTKRVLLLLLLLVTFAVPVLSGTGGLIFQPKQVTADAAGAYDKLAVELAAATAFEDARSLAKLDDSDKALYNTFYTNLAALTDGNHWGNVGLFVGPRGSSSHTDMWSTLLSPVTVDEKQMQTYDEKTSDAFSKYKAFGTAMQKLNTQSLKKKGASSSLEQGLNEVSAAAGKLTNLGTNLIKQYNPAPLVLAMVDSTELNGHSDNKLVTLVNQNENLREMISFLGTPTGFGIPWSYFLTCLAAFLLLITSVLMTLLNGRAAGENIRKMLVKIVIGCVAVPLIAKGLDWGINFLGTTADTQANTPNDQYVSQNLNLADWYATGFSVPSGVQIEIDQKGRFVLQPSDVKAINEHTYRLVTGKTPNAKAMKNRMEEAHVMLNQAQMAVSFSEPIRKSDNEPWKTTTFYQVLDQFGKNEQWDAIEKDDADKKTKKGTPSEVGYLFYNGLRMDGGDGGWTITGTNNDYGISPIAATNMMRTTFSSSSMAGNTNTLMGAVAFDVDNGENVGDAHMNAIIRFLATFALVMAAMKGLFSIITAGFGGILGGSAKGAMGSSAGLGQALGGVLALVGGVFGIGLIMTMSFTLLDQVYGVVCELFKNTTGGTDLLEPLADLVADWPFGSVLADALKDVASFLITLFCAITLPKFGGIPVTLFCQYLSELPHIMAERAQQMENKFTGDFRAGGGRMGGGGAMSGAGSLFNQAANAGKDQMKALGSGASMVGGALLGLGAAKAGSMLHNALDAKEAKESAAQSMSNAESDGTLTSGEDTLNPEDLNPMDSMEADTNETTAEDGLGDERESMDDASADSTLQAETGERQSVADGVGMASGETQPEASTNAGDLSVAENYQEGTDTENDSVSEEVTDSEVQDEDHNDSMAESMTDVQSEQSLASDQSQEHTQAGGDTHSEQSLASEQSQEHTQAGGDSRSEQSLTSEQSQQHTQAGGDSRSEHTQAGGDSRSEQRSMAEQRQAHTQAGGDNRSEQRSMAEQRREAVQQGSENRSEHSVASEQVTNGTTNMEHQRMAEQTQEAVFMGGDSRSMEQASVSNMQVQDAHESMQTSSDVRTMSTGERTGGVQPGMDRSLRDGQNPQRGVTSFAMMGNGPVSRTSHASVTTANESVSRTSNPSEMTGRGSMTRNSNPSVMSQRPSSASQPSRGQGTTTPMNGTSANASTSMSKAQQQRQQSWRRTWRGIANGLEAAGGQKSTGQRLSEVATGAMHMAGGYTGMQNMTKGRVDAVRREGQRQQDIRDNLGASYTKRQQIVRQKQQTNGSTGSRSTAGKNTAPKNPTASRQQVYQQAILNQYEQQRWEEQQDDRRREETTRQEDARRPKKS